MLMLKDGVVMQDLIHLTTVPGKPNTSRRSIINCQHLKQIYNKLPSHRVKGFLDVNLDSTFGSGVTSTIVMQQLLGQENVIANPPSFNNS